MATQYTIPNIPPATDIDTLRLSVTNAMSKLVGQLNGQTTQLDAMGQRVVNVATPTGPNDAVPLRYLKYFHQKGTQVSNRKDGGGMDAYTIVFSNGGTATNGNISPPFVVGQDRSGTPIEGWLAAVSAPTGNFTVNFLHGTSMADATHTLLATDLTVGSGSFGPVFQTNFTANVSFQHGHIIVMKVISANAAVDFSGGVVVDRT
jgi:hypothetical protein